MTKLYLGPEETDMHRLRAEANLPTDECDYAVAPVAFQKPARRRNGGTIDDFMESEGQDVADKAARDRACCELMLKQFSSSV